VVAMPTYLLGEKIARVCEFDMFFK
jgi:hypothetical protein